MSNNCIRNFLFGIVLTVILGFSLRHTPKPYEFPKLNFFPEMPVATNNPVTLEGQQLGRWLFYDTILSSNGLSCSSCHRQEAAFSDGNKSFSKGNNSVLSKRNTPALFNLAWYETYFWDGRAKSIEDQVFHPVRESSEMNLSWFLAEKRIRNSAFYRSKFKQAFGNQPIDSILISKAIGQFLRTLISHQSRFDGALTDSIHLTKTEFEGFVLMNDMTKGDCLHCHTTDANSLGTTGGYSNNGLDNVQNPKNYRDYGLGSFSKRTEDYGKFKIPSLRNIALTAPYMHDGRFSTLDQVLDFYSEGVSQSEKVKIIAFLRTLTDSTFITSREFSNPFTVTVSKN